MPRPSFSVVAGTVAALVGFGVISRVLGPFIPPLRPAAESKNAEFLRAGDTQTIRWREFSPETLAESRRRGLPILLFLGHRASRAARSYDANAFSDYEASRAIARGFIPTRIDLGVNPEWASALYPLSRTEGWTDPGCALVALNARGEIIAATIPTRVDEAPGAVELLAFVTRVREAATDPQDARGTDADTRQRDELSRFDVTLAPALPPRETALVLRDRAERDTGLVETSGGGYVSPWNLATIAAGSDVGFAADALRALAHSPMTDPLLGGTFLWRTGEAIEATKISATDAALAEVTARVAVATDDADLRGAAKRLADSLYARLISAEGVPSAVVSDQTADGLSPFYSLTIRRLSGAGLDSGIRTKLRADLDRHAFGAWPRPGVYDPTPALARLRRSGTAPAGVNRGRPEVRGYVIARLLAVARLLGDRARARDLGVRTDALHREMEGTEPPLEARLALVDAHFADFLASGRSESLELAGRGLRRTLDRHAGPQTGELVERPETASDGDAMAFGPRVPRIHDGYGESTIAMAIRLSDDIARATAPSRSASGLRRFARDCAGFYGARLPGVGPEIAGFIGAATGLQRPTWRGVGGPDAVEEASRIARKYPFELVVPAVGGAVPDVPRGPGKPRQFDWTRMNRR